MVGTYFLLKFFLLCYYVSFIAFIFLCRFTDKCFVNVIYYIMWIRSLLHYTSSNIRLNTIKYIP